MFKFHKLYHTRSASFKSTKQRLFGTESKYSSIGKLKRSFMTISSDLPEEIKVLPEEVRKLSFG
jgi:hypothetical protein